MYCNLFQTEAAAACGSGVQSRSRVMDSQFSASSHWANDGYHHPRNGRLFGTSGVAAWAAAC